MTVFVPGAGYLCSPLLCAVTVHFVAATLRKWNIAKHSLQAAINTVDGL